MAFSYNTKGSSSNHSPEDQFLGIKFGNLATFGKDNIQEGSIIHGSNTITNVRITSGRKIKLSGHFLSKHVSGCLP
jgi:hypothetical protein